MKPHIKLLCYWIKTHKQISPEEMVGGFKKYCIYDEMNGREDEEEVGNVGSEHGMTVFLLIVNVATQ
jgi:hypothetical protein